MVGRLHPLRTWRGRKIYRVLRNGNQIFIGTRGECNRFIRLHLKKAEKEKAAEEIASEGEGGES